MEDDNSKEYKLAQIPSLIEQIEINNSQIALHKMGGSPGMIRQYEQLNQRFFKELTAILAEFGFTIQLNKLKSRQPKPARKPAEKRVAAAAVV